jgi:hypothetical protein
MEDNMLSLDTTVNVENYNSLPIVEDADIHVRKNGLARLMTEKIGGVFIDHDISDSWGIGLLHHHWPIMLGERPAEDEIEENDTRAFVMRPQPTSPDDKDKYVPCLLAACDLASKAFLFESLEFSSEASAILAFQKIRTNHRFLSDLHSALVTYGLQTFFGLTSVKPLSDRRLTLVEYTRADRASILRIMKKSELETMNYVQTAWTFSKKKTAANCKRNCFKACNVPKAGGHYSTHTAIHNPNG